MANNLSTNELQGANLSGFAVLRLPCHRRRARVTVSQAGAAVTEMLHGSRCTETHECLVQARGSEHELRLEQAFAQIESLSSKKSRAKNMNRTKLFGIPK
jgi:hypothetical protein